MEEEPHFTPIRREKPEVHGVDPEARGLLHVSIGLSEYPPVEWRHFFEHPTGVGISLSMHPPTITGDTIFISPPDAELEDYVRHVDERIAAANARYEQDVLPKLQAKSAATG